MFPDLVGFGLGHCTAQYFTPWLFALFKWSLAKASDLITEIQILYFSRIKLFSTLNEVRAWPRLKPFAIIGLSRFKTPSRECLGWTQYFLWVGALCL